MQALQGAASTALQMSVSTATLHRLVKEGRAPQHVIVGKRRMWRPEDVEAWVAAQVIPANGEAGEA